MIRNAISEETNRLLEIGWKTGLFTPEELQMLLGDTLDGYQKGEIKGYVRVYENKGWSYFEETEKNVWELMWIGVDPEVQGAGVGKALLDDFELISRQKGGKYVVISTSSTDATARARAFYTKNGYTKVELVSDFYGPGDDKVVYKKQVFTVLDPSSWFTYVCGVSEHDFLKNRLDYLSCTGTSVLGPNLTVKNLKTNELWPAGSFSTFPIKLLNELNGISSTDIFVNANTDPICDSAILFEIHIRESNRDELFQFVEVSALQASAENGTMFQVASNFNCCENASCRVQLDSGEFVSDLMIDCTQGPGAASGAAVAAITRTHAAFYDPENLSDIGQNNLKQINLLSDESLLAHFPVEKGKLFVEPASSAWVDLESQNKLLLNVCIGLHSNVCANFCRGFPNVECCLLNAPSIIDQVFVSSLNMYSYGLKMIYTDEIYSKMDFLLLSAYMGTFAAAIYRETSTLVLTCVGGGVFSNPLKNIAQAILKAFRYYKPHFKHLKRIILPLYSVGADPTIFKETLESSINISIVAHS